MSFSKIEFSITAGVGRIVLADPEHRNTVDLTMARELSQAATACESEPRIKAVLVAAQGKAFSFGGDLRHFMEHKAHLQNHIKEMTVHFHAAIATLHRLRAPVVTAVNGTAAGGGMSLVCMADLAIARRSAKFNPAYTRSGLTPDGGLTYFLTRLVGPQRAFDILATNPTLSAEQAQALGIIARVVDDDLFDDAVETLVRALADAPAAAVGALKSLLRSSYSNSLEEQLALEGRTVAANAADPETIARIEAFLQRDGG